MSRSNEPIYLDASTLLGSGQTVRLAIGFSAVLQRPIVLQRIRERRDNPGLKEHHALAAKVIARMMNARIQGATIGSRELYVSSGPLKGGTYNLRIKGTGSAVNVLQSALLPAFFARHPITIVIRGGTLFPWFHFNTCVIPLLRRMGISLLPFSDNTRIGITVQPRTKLRPLVINKRGTLQDKLSVAIGNGYPTTHNLSTQVDYFFSRPEKTSVTTIYRFANVSIGFDGILGRGKEETTEQEISKRADSELETSATVDTKTAEQILPWLAISPHFFLRVAHLTEHLETALWLIEYLLKKQIIVRRNSDCISIFSKGN